MPSVSSKNRARPSSAAPLSSPTGGPPWILIAGVLAVAALTALALYPSSGTEAPRTPSTQAAEAVQVAEPESVVSTEPAAPELNPITAAQASPVPSADAPLPPLPLVPNMVPRPPEVVRDAYHFAAQNPDVLEFVPCFCGCETAGHKANADCFVQSRNPDGSVRSWDTHGMACTVCVDVARLSMQLRASGASVRDVRAAVEAAYPQSPMQTPTPTPPH